MSATTGALLDTALSYARRGWAAFPCHTPTDQGCSCRRDCGRIGKHPRTQHGLHDATTDEATLRRWWRQFPQANIGITTGTRSGLVVPDEDTAKGGDASRLDLEHSYSPPCDGAVPDRRGAGVHYLFAHPGVPVKNGVETLGAVSISGAMGAISSHRPRSTPVARTMSGMLSTPPRTCHSPRCRPGYWRCARRPPAVQPPVLGN